MVVCAVSDCEVGVDVEFLDKNILMIEQILCSRSELEYIYSKRFTLQEKNLILYKIWTYKENFLKMIGTGIVFPLGQISVDFECNKIINETSFEKDNYIREQFIDGYLVSTCMSEENSVFYKNFTIGKFEKELSKMRS